MDTSACVFASLVAPSQYHLVRQADLVDNDADFVANYADLVDNEVSCC